MTMSWVNAMELSVNIYPLTVEKYLALFQAGLQLLILWSQFPEGVYHYTYINFNG